MDKLGDLYLLTQLGFFFFFVVVFPPKTTLPCILYVAAKPDG